jgi:NAD(P)H-hydrate epimerase
MKTNPVFSASQAQLLDQLTMAQYRLGDDLLMELAGSKAADWILKKNPSSVLVLVGPGNNGGDGLVLARHLALLNSACSIYLFEAYPNKRNDLARLNWKRIQPLIQSNRIQIIQEVNDLTYDIIIDALFGTGLQRPIDRYLGSLFEKINQTKSKHIIALDCPSGLDSTTGAIQGTSLKADVTLTFGGKKTGFYFDEAYSYLGEIHVLPIGFDTSLAKTPFFEFDFETIEPQKVTRKHKYDDGYVSIIAGSANFSGAAYLACAAAIKAGAAAVELYYPKGLFPVFDILLPDVLKRPIGLATDLYFKEQHVNELLEHLSIGKKCVVLGPGIGREKETKKFVHQLLPHLPPKTILDADALFHLATYNSPLPHSFCLTPHLGELSSLVGKKITTDFDRIQLAIELAQNKKVNIFSKGTFGALISSDGICTFLPYTNHAFRKTGFGDVFSGYFAALWLTEDNIKTSFARSSQELWNRAKAFDSSHLTPQHLLSF